MSCPGFCVACLSYVDLHVICSSVFRCAMSVNRSVILCCSFFYYLSPLIYTSLSSTPLCLNRNLLCQKVILFPVQCFIFFVLLGWYWTCQNIPAEPFMPSCCLALLVLVTLRRGVYSTEICWAPSVLETSMSKVSKLTYRMPSYHLYVTCTTTRHSTFTESSSKLQNCL